MCPLCLSTLGWVIAGGASAGTLGVLIARPRNKGKDHDHDHDRNS